MSVSTTDDLLERARSGDRAALEALLSRHQAQIYRFGMKMCRDPADAEDVLQDTLLAVARGVRSFEGTSSLATWLYTIARSYCIKKRRRSKFAPSEVRSLDDVGPHHDEALSDAAPLPDEALASKEVERALNEAIKALPPMYREVLLLRDGEGLTAPEVAEVIGVSVQAVKSRLHRARATVREALAPVLGGLPDAPATGCPDVVRLFSKHLEGEISGAACAEMEAHVQACARCRGLCDSLTRTLALCSRAGADADVPAALRDSVTVALRDFLSTDGEPFSPRVAPPAHGGRHDDGELDGSGVRGGGA